VCAGGAKLMAPVSANISDSLLLSKPLPSGLLILYITIMKKELYLILDNIRSRENVGSIFRTSDAAGVKKIYLCGITPCPPHPKIEKTSLGAEKYVPWEYYKDTWRILKKLSADNYQLLALEQTKKSENIFILKTNKLKTNKLVLIVGNEVNGLSPETLKRADKTVAIPQYGQKESLNVAVAFGIAVYSILIK